MFRRPLNLIVPCLAMVALLSLPSESRAGRIWDCLFGNAPPPQTTYAPAYVAPVGVAPSCTTCDPCYSPCEPVCSPCAVRTSGYMPTAVYRALYRPVACNAYGCTVTTYRPFLGTYQTRLVPYATYRPVYAPTVTYRSYYSPCVSRGVPAASYSGEVVPTAECPTCTPAPPAATQPSGQVEPQRKTFERETKKPAPDNEEDLQPIPRPEEESNSTPALLDPNDRTARRPATARASRVRAAGYAVPAPADRNDGGWRGAEQ